MTPYRFGRRVLLALFFSAAHIPSIAARAQDVNAERALRVDSLFARYNANPSPGLALSVVRDGQVLLRRGYGLADIEHRVPIGPGTVFDVASVSKQFAGLAVAMLVQQGKVQLTDDIRRYVPELPVFQKPVTIDHLLHHTSGLRDWPGTLAVGGWRFDDVISFNQILTMAFAQERLNFVPGAEHLYSNTGYNVLAEMVQRVSGKSFRAFTTEQLLRPLGMNNSFFMDDHTEIVPNRAFGYARAADGTFHHTPNALTALGSSSLYSTVDDLALWLANFDRAGVGGTAAMTMMRTRGVLNDGTRIPYAFGISHGTYRGQPTLNHSGSWASFSTYVAYFPGIKTGIAVLANSGTISATEAAMRIADVMLAADLQPVAPVARAATDSLREPLPARILDEYTGFYRLGPGWYTRIARDGNALSTQATREPPAHMTARSEREFWVANYNAAMTFTRDSVGRVSGMLYKGNRVPKLAETSQRPATNAADYAGVYESAELGTSYRVTEQDGALSIAHARHGTMPLTRLWNDDFGTTAWFLKSVEFTRNEAGRVTGFVVNGDARSRDIPFRRR